MQAHRATTSTGAVVDDPTPAELAILVAEVARSGDGAFLIVERQADRTGQTYVQAVHQGGRVGGGWLVEVWAGNADRHYRLDCLDSAAVSATFASWAAQTVDWRALPWRHVPRAMWWRRSEHGYVAGAV